MLEKPLILVANDDSYNAPGVHALVERMALLGDVVAVCPASPQSGQSMAITVNSPLFVKELGDFHGAQGYAVSGTPVDCVKLAMHHILPRTPQLVVAGINHGSNSSVNVLYSGTMGAVMEGCAFGIPSIGFSLCNHSLDADFGHCLPAVDHLAKAVLEHSLPPGICLNVNFPKVSASPSTMRLCTPCRGKWNDEYQKYTDPHGHPYYWLTGVFENEEPENEATDQWSLEHGLISVVPVSIGRTPGDVADIPWLADSLRSYNDR